MLFYRVLVLFYLKNIIVILFDISMTFGVGYYVDTVGKNTNKIKEYISSQYKEDKLADQMSIFESKDSFKK